MAILNEIVWRTQTTDFWVAFKAFGAIPLTFIFAILQYKLLERHALQPDSSQNDSDAS
jgi:intracellular septation protein